MKKTNIIIFLISTVLLICFDLYKATHASFTHDEAFTYLNYVNESIADIISYHKSFANNHILNTLLMKVFEMFFGNSELALRFPNILSHVLYLVFTFKLFDRYSNRFFIPFFILVTANPYLIDFFSLARGYGLAIGLMTMGLYYYCRFLENQKLKNHIFSLLFIGLAALANFAMINVFLIMILIHNIFQFLIDRQQLSLKNLFHANKTNVILTLLFSAIFYKPIQTIIKDKLIIVGGMSGFWSDTVNSLLEASAYYAPYGKILVIFWQIFIVAAFVLLIFKSIKYFLGKDQIVLTQKIPLFFAMIILFIVLGTMVQHWLFEIPFLQGRFALFLYSLFMFAFCFMAADILDKTLKYQGLIFIISGMFFLHTIYTLNTSWYYDWQYDRNTKTMLLNFNNTNPEADSKIISMGVTWIFEPGINFYLRTLKLERPTRVDGNALKFPNDYFYLASEDLVKVPQDKTEVIDHFLDTENSLIRYDNKRLVRLKAMSGKYVCADGMRNNILIADRDAAYEWETFSLTLLENDECAFLAYNKLFLSAELCQENEITASRDHVSAWEIFTIIKLDSNQVAFKAANGKYLSVDERSFQLFAKSDSICKNERFEMIISTK